MSAAQAALLPVGQVWIVRIGAGGPAYWFPNQREAERFYASKPPCTSNFMFPAKPAEEAQAANESDEDRRARCLCIEGNDPAIVVTSTRDCPVHGKAPGRP